MSNALDIRNYNELERSFALAEHTVYKRYLTELSLYPAVKPTQILLDENAQKCLRFFQLEELAHKKGEDIFQKLSNVYHACMALGCSLIVMIDVERNNAPAKIYMGVRNSGESNEKQKNLATSFKALENSIKGNFPGTKLNQIGSQTALPQLIDDIFNSVNHISSVSCVAAIRDKSKTNNKEFVQGLERFIDAMHGNAYTAIFIADPITMAEQATIRRGYEELYTSLQPFCKSIWSYNENESNAVMESITEGISNSITEGTSKTTSIGQSVGSSKNIGINVGLNGSQNSSITDTIGKSSATGVARVGNALSGLGGALGAAALVSPPLAAAGGVVATVGGLLQGSTKSQSLANTIGKALGISGGIYGGVGSSTSETTSNSDTTSNSTTKTKTKSETSGTTNTIGSGKTLQIECVNKPIEEMLKRIEEQLKRVQESEDYGAYNCGAYFLAAKQESCLLAANTYHALMIGEGTSVESGSVNTWSDNRVDVIKEYLKRFVHPLFVMPISEQENDFIPYTPSTIVSGLELPLHLGLPTKSIYGLSVVEHAEFGRNVANFELKNTIKIGQIYHMGQIEETAPVILNTQSLSSHTFITGSTGSGKSNTIYGIISKLRKMYQIPTLVIEPAKGEYKQIFGNEFHVYGTNPNYTELLRINPFKFDKRIHVLEHIDRLIDIFNVCWPMYAAMPAVLKEAIEQAYINAGWNLDTSENCYDNNLYPCFKDVLEALRNVIAHSDYSQEVKDNYTGSLITRVKSLTNGLNGRIFTNNEIDDQTLFEEDTIIDLSRVGSSETKSMIMGIVIMQLQEYRMAQGGINLPLKHLTILEEAHNILKRTSTEQSSESSNILGKSVEMISNAIAEMRTYGEGFVIADQAPALLDMSAIRNTNTKIILRLPDEGDRKLVGKSAGLNDDQIVELAKLPSGVAAIYQNKWVEPVSCQIDYFDAKPFEYIRPVKYTSTVSDTAIRDRAIQYVLSDISQEEAEYDVEQLKFWLIGSTLPITIKTNLFTLLNKEKPKVIDDIYPKIAKCFNECDGILLSAKKVSDMEEWNTFLLNGLNFEVNISNVCRDNILECIVKNEFTQKENTKPFYFNWMKYMGRNVM